MLEQRLTLIEDKAAIKELVDSYLAAADQKDNLSMASFFTEQGQLTSIMKEGTIILRGRAEIADGFGKILAPLTKAYHFNGQFLVNVYGTVAKGTSYCFVILAGHKDGSNYTRKIWARYMDDYQKENGKWLIENRVATVEHEEWEFNT